MSSFGNNVRWLRTERGLTQAELAALIHTMGHPEFCESYVCRLECGNRDPRVGVVRSIARALKVKPWYLLADLTDNVAFWQGYIALTGPQKRQIQQSIAYLLERRT